MAHVADGVPLWPALRIRLVEDREHGRALRRRPATEQPWSLERIARQRAQANHRYPSSESSSSASLMASVRTTGAVGSPAVAAAARKVSVAWAMASSRLSASTMSCAPYRLVPMPVAMPLLLAT